MKTLKAKLLAAAVSGVFALNAAHALNPTDTANADIKLYLAGGGASDANLEAVVKTLLTAGGAANIDTYTFNGDKKNFWAVSGVLQDASVLGSGFSGVKKVAFYKRTNGAAFQAVGPLVKAVPITVELDINQITTYNAATHTGNVASAGGVINLAGGAGTGLVVVTPDAGVTDVNPELFTNSINVPAGEVTPSLAKVAALNPKGSNAAIHGVAVTLQLYRALQTLESLDATKDDEANQPSLTRPAIASLYQGLVSDWTQLVAWDATTSTLKRLVVPSGFDSAVYVVPRSPGAAIQASVNARILNAPSAPVAAGPAGRSLDFPPYVYDANLPGDTDAILDALDKGTATGSWLDGDNNANAFTGVKALAIGSQSTEKNTDDVTNSTGKRDLLNYRFIKIDGVSPTLRNAFNGTYPLVVEQTFTYRPGLAAASPIKKALVDYLVREAATPTILGNADKKFFHLYGQTGYLSLSTNGNTVTSIFDATKPVTGYTYGASGKPDLGRTPVLDNVSIDSSGNARAPDLIVK